MLTKATVKTPTKNNITTANRESRLRGTPTSVIFARHWSLLRSLPLWIYLLRSKLLTQRESLRKRMVYCAKCSRELPAGAAHCSACGAPASQSVGREPTQAWFFLAGLTTGNFFAFNSGFLSSSTFSFGLFLPGGLPVPVRSGQKYSDHMANTSVVFAR